MNEYNPHDIEPRWQKVWAEEKLYEVTEDTSKPKRYVLEMFPYAFGSVKECFMCCGRWFIKEC